MSEANAAPYIPNRGISAKYAPTLMIAPAAVTVGYTPVFFAMLSEVPGSASDRLDGQCQREDWHQRPDLRGTPRQYEIHQRRRQAAQRHERGDENRERVGGHAREQRGRSRRCIES